MNLDKYKDLINENSVISVIDMAGDIVYANDAFCDIFECKKDEVLGKPYSNIINQKQSDELLNEIWTTISDKKTAWEGTVRYVSNSGKISFLRGIIDPVLDDDENIIEFVAIRDDITQMVNEMF